MTTSPRTLLQASIQQVLPSVKFFGSFLASKILNQGPRGRVPRLDVRGSKTPQTEGNPRGKVKNLHLQQTGKCKRNHDKDLLTELSKNTFNLG
jgi:hypothetical protein